MAARPSAITERITDELLECGICLNEYKDPKMLPCQHAYCQGCLDVLIGQSSTGGERNILCPMCRMPARIPDTGSAKGFQTAFHINKIFELRDTLGKQLPRAPHHSQAPAVSRPTCRYTSCHSTEVTHFCDTCGPLCLPCEASHRGLYCYHKVVQIVPTCAHHSAPYCKTCNSPDGTSGSQKECRKQLSHQQKCELHTSLGEVQKKRFELKMALMNVKETNHNVSNRAVEIKTNIETEFRRLEEMLEQRKKELLHLADNLTKTKLACLDTQTEILTDIHEEICNYAMFIEQCIADSLHADFKSLADAMSIYWNTQCYKYADIKIEPCEESNLQFYLIERSIPDLHTLGVLSTGSAFPSNCLAQGNGLTTANIGEKALFTVSIRTQDNKPCTDSNGDVHAFLKNVSSDTYVDAQLLELQGNKMTFSYHHQQPGKYRLHVQVCGKEINNSPFMVIMRHPFTFKGDFKRHFVGGELKQPWGVACTGNGNIVVVDYEGVKGVTIFDAGGKVVSSFMEAMSLLNVRGPRGKCYHPSGIAVDCNGDVLVVDGGMHRIQKFSKEGKLLQVVGSCGSGELQFREPVGIQVNNAGTEVYVCDKRNDRIQVLDRNLSFLRSFGRSGCQDGQLICPWDVAFDSSQDVYITDSGNNRVQVFSPDGTYLRKFGCKGNGLGQFRDLRSICIDRKDDVYVTDCYHHRVTVFASSGDVLTTVGDGFLNGPLGISVDSDGLVYVADSCNKKIVVFT